MTFAYAATATGTAITGSISGITLTVTSVTGTIYLYSTLSGSGITTCRILYQQSGTAGGAGNYVIDTSQTVASFTGATSTETVINQTGTDTSLAGATGLTGVTTTALDSSGGFTIYNFGFNRLNINGTLSIGVTTPYEQLVIGSPYTQTGGITLNAYVQVLATGTLNLGATETAGSVSDGYQSNVLIYQPGSGYGSPQSQGLTASSNNFSGAFFGIYSGGTVNWKYGTISCWGGIGFNTTANVNIGVSGSRQKPVLDYSRTRQAGSTTNTQAVYNFGTTNLYGLVLQGGSLGTTGAYGATWAQLKAPTNFIGFEPRFCYSGFSGSTAIPAGTYTISNYAGNYGGTCDISKRSTTAVTYNFKNSALGTALVVAANASTGNFLVNAYQDLTVTGYTGAIVCFQDSSNVFYQATATSGTASFTNILLGAQLNYLTAVWTQYFGASDIATISQWAYDQQYGSASVQLRGVGGTTSNLLSVTDSNVTLSQTAANTILASNFTVNSTTGTITVRASSTLDQLYDALKAWKCTATQANLIYPTISTQPVTASGTTLSTAMSIVVNSGATLSAGTKFTSITSSGTVTSAGTIACNVTSSVTSTGTISSGVTITGSVAQATPINLSGVTIVGNLTYNTASATTVTFTSTSVSGTVSNSGVGAVIIKLSSSSVGTVGSNVTTQLVTGIALTLASGLQVYVANGSGTQVAYVSSSSTTYALDTTGGTGTWTVKVTGYGYYSQSYTFTPATSGLSAAVSLATDPYITQATKATVAAYTSLANADQTYDYAAYWETTNTGIATARVASKVASQVGLGSYNIALNSSAGSVWSLSAGTVTIKAATFSGGSTMTGGIYTTGTVSLDSGITYTTSLTASTITNAGTLTGTLIGAVVNTGTINSCSITGSVSQATPTNLTSTTITGSLTYNTGSAIAVTYTSSSITGTVSNSGIATVTINLSSSTIGTVGSNVSSRQLTYLNLNGLTAGSQIYVANGSGTQVDYVSSSGTSYSLLTSGYTGTWTWKVTNYGYTSQSGTHSPAVATTTTTVSLVADAFITQATKATVAAYTTLQNPDRVYDYAAYWETTNVGIPTARVISKAATYASAGSYPLVLTTSGSPWSLASGILTLNVTSSFVGGSTMTGGIVTTGAITDNAQPSSSGTYGAISGNTIAISSVNYQPLIATTSISGFPTTGAFSSGGSINFGSGTSITPTGTLTASSTAFSGTLNLSTSIARIVTLTDCTSSGLTINATGGGTVTVKCYGTTDATTITAGTNVTVVKIAPITAPNLISGSRVRLYNDTDGVEIYNGVLSSNGFSYEYTWTTNKNVTLTATYCSGLVAKLGISASGIISSTGVVFLDSQSEDTVYTSYGIDGSTVTEYAADYVNDEINLVMASDFTGASLYSWWVYNLTSELGIRDFFGGVTAKDSANIRFNADVISLRLDNVTSTNLIQTDNIRIYRSDSAYPVINPTTGKGGIDINWRSSVYIGTVDIVSALEPDLTIINEGVKKASLLIPHTTSI